MEIAWRHRRETYLATFWAGAVAGVAGEPETATRRVVAALLRTPSVVKFCAHAGLNHAELLESVEDPQAMRFEACQRNFEQEFERKGIAVPSNECLAVHKPPPADAVMRQIMTRIIEQHGHVGIPPLELLLDILRADRSLADRLAAHGLDESAISTKHKEDEG
jgi:uncharacterized heparinase superfamily protein